MKEKINQMFKDKLFLVMLVLGLLTIVAAAGVVTIQRGSGKDENPYVDMQGQGEFLAQEPDTDAPLAGESNASASDQTVTDEQMAQLPKNTDTAVSEETYEVAEGSLPEEAQAADTGAGAATPLLLNFTDTSRMAWPVRGNIVLDYNMESTIYFPTLDQYKCNPGLVIQSEVSAPVYAPANARVTEAGANEEIGNYLVLDLGNDYSVTCGQLKELAAVKGEYLTKGQLLGYVAEPTKYYTVEGSNLYLKMQHGEKTVDPLDYLE